MAKENPLWHKLYFREPYIELARAVGYRDAPLAEIQTRVSELCGKFGKDMMKTVSEELVDVEKSGDAQVVRLKPHVRKLCWQLLGFQPENKHMPLAETIGSTPQEEPKPEPKPKKNARKRAKPASSTSPMMKQYREAKERHPGMLLLFRIGDFYELYEQDAGAAAKILGLTLTVRDRSIAMAGFPHHQLERYLQRLLKAGQRVAVCEQVAEPTRGKASEREVTRIVTS